MTSVAPRTDSPILFPTSARVVAVLLLAIPFTVAVFWSRVKYFWIDELLEYYSDSRPSGLAVIGGQLHHPFSLEPPLYHLVLHYSLHLFPHASVFAARLPAMLLFVLLQWCLLRLVLRLTHNWGAALLAAALPFAVSTFLFAPEARVYELLAAMFALALLAYCTALQSEGRRRRRAFILLGTALAVAVLSHYYGIFEPLPFIAAEAVRAIRKRRLEKAPWIALFVSMGSFALNLPCLGGLSAVQARYYDRGQVAWDRIPFTYAWLFGQNDVYDKDPHSLIVQHVAYACVFGVLPMALVSVFLRRHRDVVSFHLQIGSASGRDPDRDAVLMAAFFTLFLPVATVTLAHCVTHAYWPRYSVETVVPAIALLCIAASPLLRGWCGTSYALFLVAWVGFDVTQVHYQHDERIRVGQDIIMATSPDLTKIEKSLTDPHIYVQQVGQFLELNTFAAPDQRRRLVEFDSLGRAAFWNMHTPVSVFAKNVAASTSLPSITYEQLRCLPGPHLILVFKDPLEEWIGPELERPGVATSVIPEGQAYNGFLYLVTFAAPGPQEEK